MADGTVRAVLQRGGGIEATLVESGLGTLYRVVASTTGGLKPVSITRIATGD
jgi:hypothetical protein